MGIIGVVAAMTMPTLIQKQQEKEIVTALKKFHSQMSQAFMLSVEKNGPFESLGIDSSLNSEDQIYSDSSEKYMDIFAPYLKITKRCKAKESNCYAPVKYKYLNGNVYMDKTLPSKIATAVLADGMVFSTESFSSDCSIVRGVNKQLQNVCGSIFVDVNGYKNPNVLGRDMFSFYVTKYGLFPRGTAMEDTVYTFEKNCAKPESQEGYGCAAWVLYNENMDYLHCDDLSWNGKKKCS